MKTTSLVRGSEIARWFSIDDDIAEVMAGIYNDYIRLGATYHECMRALLASIGMLDLNRREHALENKINSMYDNDAYYIGREIVRLPFDSQFMHLAGNTLDDDTKDKLATKEFMR